MSIDHKPLVSVVMAVFNGGSYLPEAIESILNQTYKEFEFIIINDGSTDDSEKIINHYKNTDSRIRVISRENKGLVNSLNEGIAIAQSEFIARMDADDVSLPERLSIQYDFLSKSKEVVCVGSDPIIIDDDGDEITRLFTPPDNDRIQELLLSGHCPLEHPTVMFRKSIANSAGNYRKEFEMAEDYDLWLRIGEIGKLANISLPLLKYRYLNTSISAKNQTRQGLATRKSCEEAWIRRGVIRVYTATNEWRQSDDITSKYQFSMKFGWWAHKYPNKSAAIKYAKRAIRLIPWRIDGWKLLLLTLIKN
ncbi:glycosyltransferase [Methylophaga pinxianii]|uniref:glycosyltransferase n=1 Tax=Methylophaga pinxianii TaxID=2881052 RepID=UPI001CF52690|nr:glycosyltransferase [Methylophaga pinxianii]MCB2425872.1 glycosyltransferase [Methylophaga pinxianii]UPH45113.1 glycosyltransferase [Methylophaga pinxianii]